MTTIGFIGSGNIGSQLARLAVAQGHDVVMTNSRGPETLADLIAELGPHARAATPVEAAAAGDLVVVTVPLRAIALPFPVSAPPAPPTPGELTAVASPTTRSIVAIRNCSSCKSIALVCTVPLDCMSRYIALAMPPISTEKSAR